MIESFCLAFPLAARNSFGFTWVETVTVSGLTFFGGTGLEDGADEVTASSVVSFDPSCVVCGVASPAQKNIDN